ncbi:hypothetical protein HDV00_007217 [Rhizophlyctis rosea]|nr:hypothetical protein HDV00_007217 [Rhizophlyctis rosea]
MIPPLPTELYPFVAKLCHPPTAQRLRNATRTTRKVITEHDLLIAEAGWRYYTKGVDACWEWAVRNQHEEFVTLYTPEITYQTLSEKLRYAAHGKDRGEDPQLLEGLINVMFLKYLSHHPVNDNFKKSVMVFAVMVALTNFGKLHSPPIKTPAAKLASSISMALLRLGWVQTDGGNIGPIINVVFKKFDRGGRAVFDGLVTHVGGHVRELEVLVRIGCMVLGHFWEEGM